MHSSLTMTSSSRICLLTILLATLCTIALTKSVPIEKGRNSRLFITPDQITADTQYVPEQVRDLVPAASGHGHHGRVQIKVYRGPSDGHHAPHGFWVKQPADDDHH